MQDQAPDSNGSISRELTSEEVSSKVLSELLEATLSQRERALSEREWGALKAVVKQFENSPTAFEDLVVSLVEAFLVNRMSGTLKTMPTLKQMCESIAKTLCSDPISRQRLMVFQKQLTGQQ